MIKIAKHYDYKPLVRHDGGPGGRTYVTPVGDILPSVTTILSHTADKTHLEEWRDRVGHARAESITREASDVGTLVHTNLEKYILGEARPGGTNTIRKLAANMSDVIIEQGLCNVDEIWGVEVPLYHSKLWAGSSDLVGLFNGVPSIIDFKNTRKPKKPEWVVDYRCQLAGYQMAHNWLFGTEIRQLVVMMVSRDLIYQEFIWRPEESQESENMWMERVIKYYTAD